jgi:hypothetical protein
MKFITVFVALKSPKGETVTGKILIRDGFALSLFSDPTLAIKLYEADRKTGIDVAYNEKHNAYIQKYKGLTKERILAKIKKELESAGGEVTEK